MSDDAKVDKLINALLKKVDDNNAKDSVLDGVVDLLLEGRGAELASKADLFRVLKRLHADGDLPVQVKTLNAGNKRLLTAAANKAIDVALTSAGLGVLAGPAKRLSAKAISKIGARIHSDCVSSDMFDPPGGGQVDPTLMLFYIHEKDGFPQLPAIEEGSGIPESQRRILARSRLIKAFKSWQAELEMTITPTTDPDKANLVISGRKLTNVSPETLALTDIGPPHGRQLRMIFDLQETTLSRDQFQSTAAHELGHALGISHRHVPGAGALMSPRLSDIQRPTQTDVDAAVTNGGWTAYP